MSAWRGPQTEAASSTQLCLNDLQACNSQSAPGSQGIAQLCNLPWQRHFRHSAISGVLGPPQRLVAPTAFGLLVRRVSLGFAV